MVSNVDVEKQPQADATESPKAKRTRDPSKAKEKVDGPPVVVDHLVMVDRLAEELSRDQVCAHEMMLFFFLQICVETS
jgi:hypothetical protein